MRPILTDRRDRRLQPAQGPTPVGHAPTGSRLSLQARVEQMVRTSASAVRRRVRASPPGRRVVCLLGMHRSGTSALTRVLNLLGMDLGSEYRLEGSRPGNPAGLWEYAPFLHINDRLLAAFGGTWDRPPPLPD